MLKILHLADIHIGMENYGRIDSNTGLHTRLLDFTKSLEYVVNKGIEEKIDAVLFAGDAYRTCTPSPTHQQLFASQLRRFSEADIPLGFLKYFYNLLRTFRIFSVRSFKRI